MSEFDQALTDRRLTRAVVEGALAVTEDEPQILFGDYLCLATGGSTGLRGVFISDVAALAEFVSLIMRPAIARSSLNGEVPPAGITMAFVAAGSPIHPTGCASRIMAGSSITFVPVPVTWPLPELVNRLNQIQPPNLCGYPSMIARLAREQQAGRLQIAQRGHNDE